MIIIIMIMADIHEGPVEYIVGYIAYLARRVKIQCLYGVLYGRYFGMHRAPARASQRYYAR